MGYLRGHWLGWRAVALPQSWCENQALDGDQMGVSVQGEGGSKAAGTLELGCLGSSPRATTHQRRVLSNYLTSGASVCSSEKLS